MSEMTESLHTEPRSQVASEVERRRPIIVAMGPEGGTSALMMARRLARRRGVDLVVVSVVEPPPVTDMGAAQLIAVPWTIDTWLERRRELMELRLRSLRDHPSMGSALPAPELEVVYGRPAEGITEIAQEHGAALIVMGIGPRAVARRLLSAGTAYETCRRAPCPVLAVASHAQELPRRLVIATDFSPESIHAAHEALAILADGASVHIVHGWSRFETLLPVQELKQLNDEYAASLPERFARFRAALHNEGRFVFETSAPEGKPAEHVLAIARAWKADMIAAGTHGAGALERWILGSTSNALLRGAQCSVLVVPSPGVAKRTELMRHMSGTSTVKDPGEWDAELRAFAARNSARRTTLELEDESIGAQVQESGYSLVGAAYDPHDRHVTLMFGGVGRPHFTRSIGHVHAVSVASRPGYKDQALCVESDDGRAILTFLPAAPSAV